MVFHEANAALAPLTNGIQTQEQLCELIEDLHGFRYVKIFSSNRKTYSPFDWSLDSTSRSRAANEELLREPPILNPKGRPRQKRITGALEGRPRGGGAGSGSRSAVAGRKCGACRQTGQCHKSQVPLCPAKLETN